MTATAPTLTHRPRVSVLDPAFAYVSHGATDVAATWRRFGWQPPSLERPPPRPVERVIARRFTSGREQDNVSLQDGARSG